MSDTSLEITQGSGGGLNGRLTFHEAYPLTDLQPADYNPRHLSDTAFARLQASLRKHGVIKPVILNGNGTLVAGHQRTKALKAIGETHVPAVQLADTVRLQDEIAFNLMHNRVEVDASIVTLADPPPIGEWTLIPWDQIEVQERKNPAFTQAIAGLITSFGGWGSAVCDDQGRVFLNAEYAVCCSDLRVDLLVWCLPQAQAGEAFADLTGEYGVYDWANIDAPVYNQHIVQPRRLRERKQKSRTQDNDKLAYGSKVWESKVLPWLTKTHRVVDFGSGYGDYAKKLRGEGFQVWDYEPYRMIEGAYQADIRTIVASLRGIAREVDANGLFDVCVLDSVINATTSLEYQHAVLVAVNSLIRHDGVLVLGTRSMARQMQAENSKTVTGQSRRLNFLDSHNVEVSFNNGRWMTMRYHSAETLAELLLGYFRSVDVGDRTNSTITAICRQPRPIPLEEVRRCLDLELNMPYPNDYFHNRQGPAVDAICRRVEERLLIDPVTDTDVVPTPELGNVIRDKYQGPKMFGYE